MALDSLKVMPPHEIDVWISQGDAASTCRVRPDGLRAGYRDSFTGSGVGIGIGIETESAFLRSRNPIPTPISDI